MEKEIDDWLYVMKYDDVPTNFHSPYMKQVAEKMSILKMTPGERESYSYYLKKLYNDRDEMQAAESRGIEKGMEEGLAKGLEAGQKNKAIEIARNLLSAGVGEDIISSTTGLSESEIKSLHY